MESLWFCAARLKAHICPVLGVLGCCCAAAVPVQAQENNRGVEPDTPLVAASPEATRSDTASVRATTDERVGRGTRRLPLQKMLKDLVYGVSWDRARLPLQVSLFGNSQKSTSLGLTLSRRDFSGATLRVRF